MPKFKRIGNVNNKNLTKNKLNKYKKRDKGANKNGKNN